ncbi:hypothetical protein BD410DRAFT_782772 [Rickenella mellea]|uniref:Amidohydrolase-related domain-containing protein n=1 Tax=Rickenella mellea TaxID=50990 RepID=A0A4Y7QK92_9AGAM|nr:hypothetical protein BD410DRAFT_782772 [Rickenella mellea]
MDLASSRFKRLAETAFTHSIIDNHTHPLLQEKYRNKFPLEGIFSEAQGDALTRDSIHTLACYRATKQLSELLGCEESWEAVKRKRDTMEYLDLCEMFLGPTRIQSVLLDDGLDNEYSEGIAWHDQFTSSPSKRVVRIEIVAQDIWKQIVVTDKETATDRLINQLFAKFRESLTWYAKDDDVVGFKSIICYRTGLDINPIRIWPGPCATQVLQNARDDILNGQSSRVRFAEKSLNDYIVHIALGIAGEHNKPIQFHTGLGDNDIILSRSSPSHMQPIIRGYPNTQFILLHSSYPYTREAGYLTAVYPNVYLDIGEVFPFLSASGQREVVRQTLELCPMNKVMWSTDGHYWPETYYLATLQARQALYDVLSDFVEKAELSESQAVNIVKLVLFDNANSIYRLGLTPQHYDQ